MQIHIHVPPAWHQCCSLLIVILCCCQVKLKSSTCYSASYMRWTQDQKRVTMLEVAADWHEIMLPQCTMRPPTARVNEQLDQWFAVRTHTIAPISHTKTSLRRT